MLKIGIIGASFKQNEKRLPIHPEDFKKIPEKYKNYIYIDHDYGINFGYDDNQLKPYVADVLSKDDIYKICDVVLVLKYTHPDYQKIDSDKICWGWHHLVQNKRNVDLILEKRLTAVSIEQMFENGRYILEDNRLMAGYASIMHALQLKGITGYLGMDGGPKIAVLSYGSVGKGAVDALLALNMKHIDVYTQRDPDQVTDKRPGVSHIKYPELDRFTKELKKYDIVVNCILQDPLNPIMFIRKSDLDDLSKKMFIIDISCDTGMGFDFAVSTSFTKPIIKITDNVDFYGVDHSPSVYYDTVSRKISQQILQYIGYFIENRVHDSKVLTEAIEVDKGVVVNKVINKFQNR